MADAQPAPADKAAEIAALEAQVAALQADPTPQATAEVPVAPAPAEAAPAAPAKPTYRALVGLSLPDGSRVEVGETTDALRVGAVKWLLDQGLIEKVGA